MAGENVYEIIGQIILIFSKTPGVLSGTSVIAKYGTISVCRTNDGQ